MSDSGCVCGINPYTEQAQVCLWHYGLAKAEKRRAYRHKAKKGGRK